MSKIFWSAFLTVMTCMPALACVVSEPNRHSWFEDLVIHNTIVLVGSVLETDLVETPHRYGSNEYFVASIDVTDVLRGEWDYPSVAIATGYRYNEGDRVFIFLSSNRLGDDFDFMPTDQPFAGLPFVLSPCGYHRSLKIDVNSESRVSLLFALFDGQGDLLEKAIALDRRLRIEREGNVAPVVEQSPRPPIRP